jgi:hypothetical protein
MPTVVRSTHADGRAGRTEADRRAEHACPFRYRWGPAWLLDQELGSAVEIAAA